MTQGCPSVTEPFNGAKIAILVGDQILTILRDDIPTIPWPGMWDLPGGRRENAETPTECAFRETWEELGLRLSEHDLVHSCPYPGRFETVWFLAAECPGLDVSQVVFGNEGQEWRLAPIPWFLNHEKAIPHLKDNLSDYLAIR
ncbi:MAG: NUDIX domain-containing protein [Silicimonas sp.]|nr:NUDIX domain-containing protein [Silicimonas sp.]